MTGVSEWGAGHIHCGVAVRRRPSFEPWWSGWPLMPSYGGRLGGGAVCPLCREMASSETEIGHPLEGRSATLERGGDCSVGLRGVRMGHTLGFFESFPFL